MNKNNKEIEIKIKVANSDGLYKKVLSLGGKALTQAGLEHDVMYDDGKGFFDAHKVLRIRTSPAGNFITYKQKTEESDKDNFIVRTEIETPIENANAMDEVIRMLGFVPHVIKERLNKKVELNGLVVEFHKMPFIGDFIEIEGDKEEVAKILPMLGLSVDQGINNDYTSLFFEYCNAHGLSLKTPQTFDEEKKHLQK